MFGKVSTKEIKNIKARLQSELKDKNLPFHRKIMVESLIYHCDAWLKGRAYQEWERYQGEKSRAGTKKEIDLLNNEG